MNNISKIKIFEDKNVRTIWDKEAEKWFISIVDMIEILTDSVDVGAYWRKLKQRLKAEGFENESTRWKIYVTKLAFITHEAKDDE